MSLKSATPMKISKETPPVSKKIKNAPQEMQI